MFRIEIFNGETFAVIEKQPPYMVRKLELAGHHFAFALEQPRQDLAA